MKSFVSLTIALFLFIGYSASSNIAHANDDYFYVGWGAGGAFFSGNKAILSGSETFLEDDISGGNFTGKIFGGFRFYDFLAVELALHGFGFPTEHPNEKYEEAEKLANTYESVGASISLLAFYPVFNDIEIFGKFGMLYATLSSTQTKLANEVFGDWAIQNEDGVSVLLGAGLNYKIKENLFIRAEIEWSPNIANSDKEDTNNRMKIINQNAIDEADNPLDVVTQFGYSADVDILSTTLNLVYRF